MCVIKILFKNDFLVFYKKINDRASLGRGRAPLSDEGARLSRTRARASLGRGRAPLSDEGARLSRMSAPISNERPSIPVKLGPSFEKISNFIFPQLYEMTEVFVVLPT